ncbi:sulfotransferase family 2 domain-containing protein [Acetobacter fallax]|nr:sulfotransferase family 2 domain-containing protein [Acetobacter fallax]
MHERCSELGLSLPQGQKRRNRHELIRKAGVLFIHVPKNAGTAVCRTLYGQELEHRSIRYFRKSIATLSALPSVAIIRDPAERFVSAYRHALGGGGRHRDLAETFSAGYAAFKSMDDALDHVEQATDWYQVDHIFRPQSWYVTDGSGRILVDQLFHITNLQALSDHLFPDGSSSIPRLNDAITPSVAPTPQQIRRIRALYRQDYDIQARVLNAA